MKPMKPLFSLFLWAMPLVALAEEGHAVEGAAEGIPWGPIALHAFNLAVLLAVLAWFAGPKIRDALGNRAANVKRAIDEATAARKDARTRFDALEARLSGFEGELASMRDKAEADARREAESIAARGERDAAAIAESAERSIQDQVRKARVSLREHAVDLAVDLARERVKGEIGAEDQHRLAGDFLEVVKQGDNGVGHV